MEWLTRLKYLKSQTSETYKSISEKTGIPKTTVEKIFAGRTADPKLNTIRSIVHCLGFTLDDLVEEPLHKEDQSLSERELKIIKQYRSLTDEGKSYIDNQLNIAASVYKQSSAAKTFNSDIAEDMVGKVKNIVNTVSITHE